MVPPPTGNLFGGPGQIPLASLQDNSKEEEEEAEQHVEHQIWSYLDLLCVCDLQNLLNKLKILTCVLSSCQSPYWLDLIVFLLKILISMENLVVGWASDD